MSKKPIHTAGAPEAIGPYSQAIMAGEWVFCSGQLGADPDDGTLPEGIEDQTRRALLNLGAVLDAAGCAWKDVVKTTVFLADMSDFAAFNEVYAAIIERPYPARATVEAGGLPKAALVEIEAIARRSG